MRLIPKIIKILWKTFTRLQIQNMKHLIQNWYCLVVRSYDLREVILSSVLQAAPFHVAKWSHQPFRGLQLLNWICLQLWYNVDWWFQVQGISDHHHTYSGNSEKIIGRNKFWEKKAGAKLYYWCDSERTWKISA